MFSQDEEIIKGELVTTGAMELIQHVHDVTVSS